MSAAGGGKGLEVEFRQRLEALKTELAQARETVRAMIAGEVDAVSGAGGEQTLLRQAQETLRSREAELRAIFEGTLDAMLIADDEGRYVDANPAALELFGVEREQILGRTPADFSDETEAFDESWRAFLSEGRAEGEFTLRRPDGERRRLEFRATAGIVPGRHLSVLRDVTERRRLEEELVRSQRLESVGRLAGGIAHDFNNMLSAIVGFAGFLAEEIPPSDPKHEDTQEILRAAERAAEMVRQLLAFGRKQVLSPRTVVLSELIEDAVAMTRRLLREDIELVVDVSEASVPVHVDPGQLEQVVVNLVLNARDALPEGGSIWLTASSAPWEELEKWATGLLEPHPYAVLSVRDDGEGMTDEVRGRIFEPYFSTKERGSGTGLGLATAYGIVKQSGGHITVDGAPGEGADFRVYLPLAARVPASERPASIPAPKLRGSETVLVVEDEAVVRSVTSRMLRNHGYRVLVARDPGDALLVAEQEEQPIDLLLTDVVMPRMNGPELAERLARDRPAMTILFMTGYASEQLDRSREHGLVRKPFGATELLRAVRRALDSE